MTEFGAKKRLVKLAKKTLHRMDLHDYSRASQGSPQVMETASYASWFILLTHQNELSKTHLMKKISACQQMCPQGQISVPISVYIFLQRIIHT